MLEIQDFKIDSIEDIIYKISKENREYIDLYFPKNTILFSSSNEDIAYDYARLAYVGHKLNECSEILKYEVVQPDLNESILFQVIKNNLDKLCKTLLSLSYLYENAGDEESLYTQEELFQYISDVENNKLQAICPEFIEIYNEYNAPNNPK